MGSGQSNIGEEPFCFTSPSVCAATDENLRVIVQHDWVKVGEVTCFSTRSFEITKEDKLELCIQGAGVLRIGITQKDPRTNADFLKDALFEIEDGFSSGISTRWLFINDAMDVCYGPKDDYMEYAPTHELPTSAPPVYLYVTFGYGKPTLSVHRKHESVELTYNEGTLLHASDGHEITLTKVKNMSVMQLQKKLVLNMCYHIQWDMMLSNETIGDRPPKYGYLRLGLATNVDTDDLPAYSLNNAPAPHKDNIVWFTECAVAQYPYSGIIGFVVRSRGITHNLLVNSVGSTVTERFARNLKQPVYLLIEASSGDFTVSRSSRYIVKQSLGSTVLVNDYKEFDSRDDAKYFISAHIGHEPYRIQYGPHPKKFIVMFNRLLTLTERRFTFGRCIEVLPDTDTVQILYNNKDDPFREKEVYILKEAFERRQQTGGGRIKRMQRVASLLECWTVQYEDIQDAIRVWMRQELTIEGVTVRILPWYDALGVATNFGEKPTFDDSDLVMADLDQDKLSFVIERENEKTCFEKVIAEQLPISITWPQSDGFEHEEVERLAISITLLVDECSHELRTCWKETARKEIGSYFLTHIISREMKVKRHNYEPVIGMLKQHSQQAHFVWEGDRQSYSVNMICSDKELLITLVHEILTIDKKSEWTTEIISKTSLNKYRYLALGDEGRLSNVENQNRNTYFVITEDGDIKIRGPREEVDRAKQTILELAANTSEVSEEVSIGEEQLFNTELGKKCLEPKLKQNKLSYHYRVEGKFCKIWIFVEKNADVERKTNLFKKTVHSVFIEKVIPISKENKHISEKKPLSTFVRQLAIKNWPHPVYIKFEETIESIYILGTDKGIREIENALINFLSSEATVTRTVGLSFDVMTYMDEFGEVFQQDPFNIEKNIDALEKKLTKEASEIRSYWFRVSQPWLTFANEERDNSIEVAKSSCNCIVDIESAHSLVISGVSCIAIEDNTGTVCTSICCDLTNTPVDAILIPLYSSSLPSTTGLAGTVTSAGGQTLSEECKKYMGKNGPLKYGNSVLLGPGNLPCQAVVFVCLHTETDDTTNTPFASVLTTCLEVVQKNCFTSILIPVAALCPRKDVAKPLDEIMKTTGAFVSKNRNGTLKEIGFCDTNLDVINTISKAMTSSLQRPWFVFNHGIDIKPVQKQGTIAARPLSSRGRRKPNEDRAMRWGQERYSYPTENNSDEDGESVEERKSKFKPKKADIEGGLPYTINITETVELKIVKDELQNIQCDVIVNPTPQFPELVGAISNAILRRGGDTIKTECQHHGSIRPDEVMVSTAGDLKCTNVYHVLQPMDWQPSTGFDDVYNIVYRCLETANRHNVASITFPAIGTGASHFPADQVVEAMLKAAFNFTGACVNNSVTKITIVVFYRDLETVKMFTETVPSLILTSNNKDDPRGAGRRAGRNEIRIRQEHKFESLPKRRPVKHTDKDDILFVKVTQKGDVMDTVKKFKDRISSKFIKTEVKYDIKENLEPSEVSRIKQLEAEGVVVTIDQKNYIITLEGLRKHVDSASLKLDQLLKLDFNAERDGRKLVQRVCEAVQWFYQDADGQLKEVDNVSNFDIQLKYSENEDFIYYNNKEKKKYQVLIASLEEHPLADSTKRRRLFQRQKLVQGITLPDSWSINTSGKTTDEIVLSQASPEYDEVKRKFLAGGCKPTSILSIKRIEDRYKYLQYASKKIQLENQNANGMENERRLWHGTDADTYLKIIKHGFDRNYRGKNAVVYGEGVYFARNSSYSNEYAHPDGTGTRRMFLAKVLTGEYCQGRGGMFFLPEKRTVNNVKINYDSAVDILQNPGIYVIFHDTQAYPEYLIEYKK